MSVVCVLCRGMISFKAGDKTSFESHLQHHHQAYFDLDLLLALSFITEHERREFLKTIAVGHSKRVDIKSDIFTGLETGDTTAGSDFSLEDNEKIYGVPEPVVSCSQCPRTFMNLFSLRRHEHLHRERNFSCEVCGDRFSFLEDLKAHRDDHEEFRKINLSDEMYVAKDNSDTPVDTTQNNESQPPDQKIGSSYVRCKICLKVMKRESYQEHKTCHRDDKKHQCGFCKSKFRKEQLVRHVRRCQKKNASKSSLLSFREEIHSYSCSTCSINFPNEDMLRDHLALHFPNGLKQHIASQSSNPMKDHQESYYIPMK